VSSVPLALALLFALGREFVFAGLEVKRVAVLREELLELCLRGGKIGFLKRIGESQ